MPTGYRVDSRHDPHRQIRRLVQDVVGDTSREVAPINAASSHDNGVILPGCQRLGYHAAGISQTVFGFDLQPLLGDTEFSQLFDRMAVKPIDTARIAGFDQRFKGRL